MDTLAKFEHQYKFTMAMLISSELNDFYTKDDPMTIKKVEVGNDSLQIPLSKEIFSIIRKKLMQELTNLSMKSQLTLS